MSAHSRAQDNSGGGISGFFWNLVGGSLVSAMMAGVIYVLVAMMASFLNQDSSYWELVYLQRYFITVLIVYLVMPAVLANIIMFIFGKKSTASGTKPRRK